MGELHVITSQPDSDDIIEMLEKLMDRARAGEFSSVAVAIVRRDGDTEDVRSHLHHTAIMLGAIEALKHHITKAWLDD